MQNCIMFVINGEIGDVHDLDLNEIPEVEPIEMDETNDEFNQRFIETRNLFDSLTKMKSMSELNNDCE